MVTVMGMIFYLSHQPGDFVQLPQFAGLDKLLHLLAYGILAGTFLFGLHPFTSDADRAAAALIAVLFCLLFGISDEFHQSFIPGRFASAWDAAADTFGALLVAAWWFWQKAGNAGKDYS